MVYCVDINVSYLISLGKKVLKSNCAVQSHQVKCQPNTGVRQILVQWSSAHTLIAAGRPCNHVESCNGKTGQLGLAVQLRLSPWMSLPQFTYFLGSRLYISHPRDYTSCDMKLRKPEAGVTVRWWSFALAGCFLCEQGLGPAHWVISLIPCLSSVSSLYDIQCLLLK